MLENYDFESLIKIILDDPFETELTPFEMNLLPESVDEIISVVNTLHELKVIQDYFIYYCVLDDINSTQKIEKIKFGC